MLGNTVMHLVHTTVKVITKALIIQVLLLWIERQIRDSIGLQNFPITMYTSKFIHICSMILLTAMIITQRKLIPISIMTLSGEKVNYNKDIHNHIHYLKALNQPMVVLMSQWLLMDCTGICLGR